MTTREAERRIQALFDDTLDEDEFAELEEALALDAGLRETYKDYARLQAELEDLHEAPPAPPARKPAVYAPTRRVFLRSIGIAAAILMALALALHFSDVSLDPPTLTLRSSQDTRLRIDGPDGKECDPASAIPAGSSIRVDQGTVELEFSGGVRSVVCGPAHLTYVDPEQLRLHEGTAWFHVSEPAVGFRVHTPGMTVTDLGTEFGVIGVPGSTEEVHVLEGRVEVRSLFGFKETAELAAGESRRLGIRGDLGPAPSPSQPFVTSLPDTLPYLHFRFDEVDGDRTPVEGKHPALAKLVARMIQSDDRDAAARLVEGRFGSALRFDGAGDLIETNWPGVYGSQPLTLALWFKPESGPSYAGLVGWGLEKTATPMPRQWKLVLAPSAASRQDDVAAFRCAWGQSSTISRKVRMPRDEWIHLAIVFDGSDPEDPSSMLRFYLNGEPLPSRAQPMPDPPQRPQNLADAAPMTFGDPLNRRGPARRDFLKGSLDEVFVIEGALTDEQVRGLFRDNRYR